LAILAGVSPGTVLLLLPENPQAGWQRPEHVYGTGILSQQIAPGEELDGLIAAAD